MAEVQDIFGSDEEEDDTNKKSENEMEELFGSDDGAESGKDANDDMQGELSGRPSKSTEMSEVFGSDEEEEIEMPEKISITRRLSHESRPEMHDVFGSDIDEEEDEEAQNSLMSSQDTIKPTEHCNICIPQTHRLSDNPHLILKLPGFVKIQPNPFSSELYNASSERDIYSGATAMMRWRYKLSDSGDIARDSEGHPIRESNSRLVKFSDGTYQLLIGDEAFECNILPVRDR